MLNLKKYFQYIYLFLFLSLMAVFNNTNIIDLFTFIFF